MKKIIYTINAYPLPYHLKCGVGLSLKQIAAVKADPAKKQAMFAHAISRAVGPWEKLPLEQFYYYANEVGADFHQISEEPIQSLCLPPTLHGYQACNMLKFYMFHHFINSDYNQMLYLDLDILIKENARNIFDCIQDNGIHMTVSGDKKQIHAHNYWLKNNFKVNSDTPFYNGGIIYADRKSITDFYQKVPQLGEWQEYYKKYNLHENFTADNDVEFNEQNWLSFFFREQNIEIKELSRNWNSPALSQDKGDDFIHYYGEEGKRELIELHKKRQATPV